MLCSPETTVCVAATEQVSLGLDETLILRVRLEPRFGEVQAFDLEDGSFDFPQFTAPNFVTVRWLGEDVSYKSYVDVCDRQYFALKDLIAYGDGRDDFEHVPEQRLYQVRQAATEVFEQAANRSFVHRMGRTKDYGKGVPYLAHNDVYELLTDGYRLLSDCQVEEDGSSFEPFPRWIEYFYGLDAVPAQVSRAVLELAAYMLRPSNRPLGATSESTDAGYIHFTTAGRDGATDIPEVNAAIEAFGRGEHILW